MTNDSSVVRIGIESHTKCKIRLTGISDSEAKRISENDNLWVETSCHNRFIVLTLTSSEDVKLKIALGGRSYDSDELPYILFKRLAVNQTDLLKKETIFHFTPIAKEFDVRKNEHASVFIEWDVQDVDYDETDAIERYESAMAGSIATNTETEFEKENRLTNWSRQLSELEEKKTLLQPIEYVVIDEKRLVYIVNSKVANTSIKYSMTDQFYADDYSIHYRLFSKGISIRNLTEEQMGYYKFTFVRNPLSRLVSCYESKYHIDREIYKKKRLDLDDYLDGYLRDDEGFERFIEKVCEIPDRLMDRHFCLQSMLVFDEDGNNRCDFVGKIERIAEEFEPIREKYSLRSLPKYNMTHVKNWMDYYTVDTAKLVYEKYYKDFELFGYQDEYKRLIAHIEEHNY